MKRLKKHSIGYNTVSSTNGLVSARGVKSKPNDLQVFGFTHEIGEGEKSPDNPYTLVSLDSGNMNLCNNWNYTSNLFTIIGNRITVQKASNTIQYAISSFKEFTYDKTKLYIYLKYRGSFTAGAKIPVCSIKLYTVEKKQLYYRMISDRYPKDGFNKCIEIDLSSIDINSIAYYSLIIEGLTYDGSADYDFTVDVLMCENYIYSYFEDKHSIVLSNNDRTIRVPTPIALNCVKNISDYIYKDIDGTWKLAQNCRKYEFTGKENFTIQSINSFGIVNFLTSDLRFKKFSSCICSHFVLQNTTISNTKVECIYPAETSSLYLRIHQTRFSTVDALKTYLAEQYQSNVPITLVFYLYTPISHVLSDYTQQLLNSFTLQNTNRIFVDGYPDVKISGYIQK